MTYRLEWVWTAYCDSKPDEARINQIVYEKVASIMYDKFKAKGYSVSIEDVVTTVKVTQRWKTYPLSGSIPYWQIDATTNVVFDTDAPVFGSPIDPATATLIATVISAVVSLLTVALYLYGFITVRQTIYDVGSGFNEVLGTKGFGGLAVFFILILVLVFLYVVGKYFVGRKKRR